MKLVLPHVQRVKTGDRLTVSFAIPKHREDEYAAMVKKGQPYDRYDLVIETARKKRSTGPWSQSHHLNGHCMQIANATGQDFESVKLYAKRQAVARGLPLKTKPDGSLVYNIADGQPVPISETDMDTVQCGLVIEELHILAAEMSVILREE